MLQPSLKKNDGQAKIFIWTVSIIVFVAVAVLSRVKLSLDFPFNVHVFATFNAVINSIVAILLVAGLITAKNKNYVTHKKIMITAIVFSVLFLLSYICHHLFAGETRYGDLNHDGVVNLNEEMVAGSTRIIYKIILFTHIPLAAIILPFILKLSFKCKTTLLSLFGILKLYLLFG